MSLLMFDQYMILKVMSALRIAYPRSIAYGQHPNYANFLKTMGEKTNNKAEEQSRSTKQRKLRSSCDECGNVKLKCDRGQPECGRCVSHGMKCVYSVSRKLGKPPKNKSATASSSDGGGASSGQNPRSLSSEAPHGEGRGQPRHGGDRGTSRNVATNGGGPDDRDSPLQAGKSRTMISSPNHFDMNAFPGLGDLSNMSWRLDGAADGTNDFDMNLDFETLRGPSEDSLQHPSLLTLTPPEVDDLGFEEMTRAILQAEPDNYPIVEMMSSIPSRMSGSSSIDTAQTGFSDIQTQDGEHNCTLAAHKILERLSPNYMSSTSTASSSYATSGSSVGSSASRPATATTHSRSVTLDHVLHLNRDAINGLNSLLNCNCKRSASLVLLYTSIVSRILAWYQHAVDSLTSIRNPDLPSRRSSSSTCFSMWNKDYPTLNNDQISPNYAHSTTSDKYKMLPNDGNGNYNGDGRLVVAPTKVAAGAFNVDDMVVQAALNIHLLSGEMRRVGRLIDRFTPPEVSFNGYHPQPMAGNAGFGSSERGINDLTRSLDQWLKGEHSRLTNVIKIKIHELNN